MRKYEIKTTDNQTFRFESQSPHSSFPSFFAFGIYKGGSSLMFAILNDICQQNHGIPVISLPDLLFLEGISFLNLDSTSVTDFYTQEGYGFVGFREMPNLWIKEFLPGRKKIVLLRDPRDILVSLYYSMKYSHDINKKNKDIKKWRNSLQYVEINQFVIQKKENIKSKFDSYHNLDHLDLVKLFRYEDVILSKKEWIKDMCDFLGLSLNKNQVQEILNKHDIIPDTENINSHIRRVIPGDHLNKLNPEIIEELNEYFRDYLHRYNYI